MIKIEEILSNNDKYDIIDPLSFKYVTPCFKKKYIKQYSKSYKYYRYLDLFTLAFYISLDSYSIAKDIKCYLHVTKFSIFKNFGKNI